MLADGKWVRGKEMVLPTATRPASPGPTRAVRDTSSQIARRCHLTLAWGARVGMSEIRAAFAPSTNAMWLGQLVNPLGNQKRMSQRRIVFKNKPKRTCYRSITPQGNEHRKC
jgi:hypothetical protein